MPGALPAPNRRAVELTLLAGLALQCTIPPVARFARKSYFYPDLPKGYQISQQDLPLAVDGFLEIEVQGGIRRIGIDNVHLEEDAGKLIHREGETLVDFNRAGVPLIEIVSRPDVRSAGEAAAYATALRELLVYLGINTGDMEQGMLRYEVSVSVRPIGSEALYPRHEIKNLNSFRALEAAVVYEFERQVEVVRDGGRVAQQTMGWDEQRGVTYVQRAKEHARDYRYVPEPNLPPLAVESGQVAQLRAQLPELPAARRARFISAYGLSEDQARLLVGDRSIADYYEAVLTAGTAEPQTVVHWITGSLFRLINEAGWEAGAIPISPHDMAEVIKLVEEGRINRNTGQEVLEEVSATGRRPAEIVTQRDVGRISDEATLREIVAQVLDAHPVQVNRYLGGREQIAGWLMGQVMQATRGRAHPRRAQALLEEELEARRG
jgi:aspartyl-tRNA(Asn)/glutamyl-tRNA(Gln) amidotransferase subunit B